MGGLTGDAPATVGRGSGHGTLREMKAQMKAYFASKKNLSIIGAFSQRANQRRKKT